MSYQLLLLKNSHLFSLSKIVTILFLSAMFMSTLTAAPYWGTISTVKQPDNSKIQVRMFGDEFYGWYETMDGYSIVKDKNNGWYHYAVLNNDSSAFIASGIKVTSENFDKNLAQSTYVNKSNIPDSKHLKLKQAAIFKLKSQKKDELNQGIPSSIKQTPLSAPPSLQQNTRIGHYIGITLLIDFIDDPATIPVSSIDNFCNQFSGYSEYGNNGSVRQYFYDISGGKLDYTNVVTNYYYRAMHPKTYYTDPSISYGLRARELITEALNYLENIIGFNFSSLSTNPSNTIYAINCLYSGYSDGNWAEGLWPHSWNLYPVFIADGVQSGNYQITNIGNSLYIRTFIHENGHLLMQWPDLYDYGYQSVGAGDYDLMAYGASDQNPVPTNPYLRYVSGWENVTDITFAPNNSVFNHVANSVSSFWFYNTNNIPSNEFFAIESRRKLPGSRNEHLPDSGLLIWHVDTYGNNDFEQMTCSYHYLVSVEQADGNFDLEHYNNWGDAFDLFQAGEVASFNDFTTPNSNWWCTTIDGNYRSYLNISNVSAVGPTMSFTFQSSSTISVTHPLQIIRNPSSQSITVTTGYNNQEVNLYSSRSGINYTQITSGGSATFSILANIAPDTIWVTVTGGAKRYQGKILVVESSPPTDTVALVMGFEKAALWSVWVGSATLTNSTTKTQGTYSLQISGNNFRQIMSYPLKTNNINGVTSHMAVDIYVPITQSVPYWWGQVQAYINCPSANIYNRFVGQKDLNGLPRGAFTTFNFNLPDYVLTALAGDHNDFKFSFTVNYPAGTSPIKLDNLRFTGSN
jgi:M6 family metalloprotease-like protein